MNFEYIVVQAGGRGTRMESLTKNKPKALVPVDNLPILFHLFKKYPDKRFIVIGDYKYDVLKRYLKAFAHVNYILINGSGAVGTCAGLKKAVAQVPDGEPLMLIWSDLVLPEDFSISDKPGNYIGIAKDFPCRWKFENGELSEQRSENMGVAGLFLFQNKAFLNGIPEEGEFVRWLSTKQVDMEPLELYGAKEYGLISEYKKHTSATRCRPFNRITVEGAVVTKVGIDEQGRNLSKRECTWYQQVMDYRFAQIPKIYSLEPLKMELIDGVNIYGCTDLSPEQKRDILIQLVECLKNVQALGQIPADRQSYWEAYIGKTFDRLEKIKDLVPFVDQETIIINGRSCRNIFFQREKVEREIMSFMPETFKFLHGDCTFSNILLREGATPVLIDPRGYFGNTEFYGDPAYDWAKLYYSIVGNYDQFNLKRFTLDFYENNVSLQIESNHWEDMEPLFFQLLEGEVTPKQVKLLHAIIWLSLTTYAWEDYDSICGAFYNGISHLEEVL